MKGPESPLADPAQPAPLGPVPAPRPISITLLTQGDCALCEHAKDVLTRVGRDHPLTVDEVDLASPEGRELAVKHAVLFAPGVLIAGRPFSYGRLSEKKLRRALQRIGLAPHAVGIPVSQPRNDRSGDR